MAYEDKLSKIHTINLNIKQCDLETLKLTEEGLNIQKSISHQNDLIQKESYLIWMCKQIQEELTMIIKNEGLCLLN